MDVWCESWSLDFGVREQPICRRCASDTFLGNGFFCLYSALASFLLNRRRHAASRFVAENDSHVFRQSPKFWSLFSIEFLVLIYGILASLFVNGNAGKKLMSSKVSPPMDVSSGSDNTKTSNCLDNSTGHSLKSCLTIKTQQDSFNSSTHSVGSTKSVRYDTVEFREYPIILCDNPSTSSGPPIGLGWAFDPKDTIRTEINAYEAYETVVVKQQHSRPNGVRMNYASLLTFVKIFYSIWAIPGPKFDRQ
jgi:hypothetical protein